MPRLPPAHQRPGRVVALVLAGVPPEQQRVRGVALALGREHREACGSRMGGHGLLRDLRHARDGGRRRPGAEARRPWSCSTQRGGEDGTSAGDSRAGGAPRRRSRWRRGGTSDCPRARGLGSGGEGAEPLGVHPDPGPDPGRHRRERIAFFWVVPHPGGRGAPADAVGRHLSFRTEPGPPR